MSTKPVNVPDCEACTAELLDAARSLFDAAVMRETINTSARDQIAYKFQLLLEEYMRAEKQDAIGTLSISFNFLKYYVQY